MAGLACLALTTIGGVGSFPGQIGLWLTGVFGIGGVACLALWWARRRVDRYDLRRLWDEPPPSTDEPYEDTLPAGDGATPYCGWCDAIYPSGTYRCTCCGRVLR